MLKQINDINKMQAITKKARDENAFIVELDGMKIQSEDSFLDAIEEGFKFPTPGIVNREDYSEYGVIEGTLD